MLTFIKATFNFQEEVNPKLLLKKKKKNANEMILPFVTTYRLPVSNLKQTLMDQWSLSNTKPAFAENYLFETFNSIKEVNL